MYFGNLPSARRRLFCAYSNFEKSYQLHTPMGQVEVITKLVNALWRVSFMLPFNCSLIKTKATFVNIRKVLASTASMWILHVKFQSKITQN